MEEYKNCLFDDESESKDIKSYSDILNITIVFNPGHFRFQETDLVKECINSLHYAHYISGERLEMTRNGRIDLKLNPLIYADSGRIEAAVVNFLELHRCWPIKKGGK